MDDKLTQYSSWDNRSNFVDTRSDDLTSSLEVRVKKRLQLGPSASRTLTLSLSLISIFLLALTGFLVWWFLFHEKKDHAVVTPSISRSVVPVITNVPSEAVFYDQMKDAKNSNSCFSIVAESFDVTPYFSRNACSGSGEWIFRKESETVVYSNYGGLNYCLTQPTESGFGNVFGDFNGCKGAYLQSTTAGQSNIYFQAYQKTYCVSEVSPNIFVWNPDSEKCLSVYLEPKQVSDYDHVGEKRRHHEWFMADFGHLLT